MIELPFQMTFDLDFTSKMPKKNLLDKLLNLFLNINPPIIIDLSFREIDKDLFEFIFKVSKHFKINITALEPILNDTFFDLIGKKTISIKISDSKYDLNKLSKISYNLILPFENNVYEYLKKNYSSNISTIIILHNKNISYFEFKNQLELITADNQLNKKCYLLPYLEEYEQKNYYSNLSVIRPFLTCASLWINPKIDSDGKINFPCYCCEKSLLQAEFLEIWDSDELNTLRNNLTNIKQFPKCKYCEKFYKENFFIVENGMLQYKNKKFIFENMLNPTKSAPIIAITCENDVCLPYPLYSQENLEKIYNRKNLVLIIK